jgi:hypothetical protein
MPQVLCHSKVEIALHCVNCIESFICRVELHWTQMLLNLSLPGHKWGGADYDTGRVTSCNPTIWLVKKETSSEGKFEENMVFISPASALFPLNWYWKRPWFGKSNWLGGFSQDLFQELLLVGTLQCFTHGEFIRICMCACVCALQLCNPVNLNSKRQNTNAQQISVESMQPLFIS